MRHTIAAVQFVPRTSDGPCVCTCGWTGPASTFANHRRSLGLKAGERPERVPSVWSTAKQRARSGECSEPGCGEMRHAKGFCSKHYHEWKRRAA